MLFFDDVISYAKIVEFVFVWLVYYSDFIWAQLLSSLLFPSLPHSSIEYQYTTSTHSASSFVRRIVHLLVPMVEHLTMRSMVLDGRIRVGAGVRGLGLILTILLTTIIMGVNTQAGRLKQHMQYDRVSSSPSSATVPHHRTLSSIPGIPIDHAKWHQPRIDPSLDTQQETLHIPIHDYGVAADYLADYAAFENEDYEQAIMAMLEEHIAMSATPLPAGLGQPPRE